ncbi:unnamed protein product [Zymoseptoria tritici ST99CH_1A5]|uniref:Major facilitator superfamily (MFS) profile domain-containing protein n=1 Tax=Zymoseptoria tritici ST99CH_1A5 TaxID=1276529 RepID=A0A1Y6LTR8_ZYMTR|nr:unnamed protein product [Zymoseptoria tritici ST99CH_1A5]
MDLTDRRRPVLFCIFAIPSETLVLLNPVGIAALRHDTLTQVSIDVSNSQYIRIVRLDLDSCSAQLVSLDGTMRRTLRSARGKLVDHKLGASINGSLYESDAQPNAQSNVQSVSTRRYAQNIAFAVGGISQLVREQRHQPRDSTIPSPAETKSSTFRPSFVPDSGAHPSTLSNNISEIIPSNTARLAETQPTIRRTTTITCQLGRVPSPDPASDHETEKSACVCFQSAAAHPLDTFIHYREEKADWKRESLTVQPTLVESAEPNHRTGRTRESEPATISEWSSATEVESQSEPDEQIVMTTAPTVLDTQPEPDEALVRQKSMRASRFRHISAEVGFCFTIAMTQFLAEYLITGFAIELPRIVARIGAEDGAGSMGTFWPASLLSLILSATLLIFARISDMYGGYLPFMFGVTWLFIWTSVAGFANSLTLLDVSRAMQGLAIAAFVPSTFAMIGSIYSDGPRKNFVLGMYAGFAPLGFFGGFLAAGALPEDSPGWYFWIAAAISFITVVTAYLTVPRDAADREAMDLKMDWAGAILITGGLILVAYALAVEPYASELDSSRTGWSYPMVLGPLISGMFALGAAFYVEGWVARCPLLPFSFFRPKSVKAFSFACLCFYASYGVWLYESAKVLQSPYATGTEHGIQGVTLALWYVPTALGGLLLCMVGGALLHIVPILLLLFISGLAWIGAPLLLALCPIPMNYWAFVMPSMLCATAGIDLTFTISVVFLSAVQPLKHQGLAGAVSSILVNLAMSFSLSISEIVSIKAKSTIAMPDRASAEWAAMDDVRTHRGSQAAFIYAAASAGLGLIVCILFVRISRSRVNTKPVDEECPREKNSRPVSSEAPTLTERES